MVLHGGVRVCRLAVCRGQVRKQKQTKQSQHCASRARARFHACVFGRGCFLLFFFSCCSGCCLSLHRVECAGVSPMPPVSPLPLPPPRHRRQRRLSLRAPARRVDAARPLPPPVPATQLDAARHRQGLSPRSPARTSAHHSSNLSSQQHGARRIAHPPRAPNRPPFHNQKEKKEKAQTEAGSAGRRLVACVYSAPRITRSRR